MIGRGCAGWSGRTPTSAVGPRFVRPLDVVDCDYASDRPDRRECCGEQGVRRLAAEDGDPDQDAPGR